MTKTIQDKIYLALFQRGEKEIKRLRSCIVMSKVSGGYYYLGVSGSLRQGMTRASSVPVHSSVKQILVNEGMGNG